MHRLRILLFSVSMLIAAALVACAADAGRDPRDTESALSQRSGQGDAGSAPRQGRDVDDDLDEDVDETQDESSDVDTDSDSDCDADSDEDVDETADEASDVDTDSDSDERCVTPAGAVQARLP